MWMPYPSYPSYSPASKPAFIRSARSICLYSMYSPIQYSTIANGMNMAVANSSDIISSLYILPHFPMYVNLIIYLVLKFFT